MRKRKSSLNLDGAQFRAAGHALVDQIADFLDSFPDRAVTRGETPAEVKALLEDRGLPDQGSEPQQLLAETAELLFDHSLHNGHPRFLGYITSSATPMGALADMLAASVNSNIGLWNLAPVATEIELSAVRWLAELIGMPSGSGGLMVSGGNMANILAFIAARRWKADWDIRGEGLYGDRARLTVFASEETHTWLQSAADTTGIGTSSICWVPVDDQQRLDVGALEQAIADDLDRGHRPFMVVGTAGSVSTGAVDPLEHIARVCQDHGLWFHVDGAYGAPAACLPELAETYRGLELADSVALDPHKWLYAPLEAACTLVREPRRLIDAFSFRPDYYRIEEEQATVNLYEYGLQNSRGFRALKVWLALRAAGRQGYVQLIREDIDLAGQLYEAVGQHPELEAGTLSLSIATFRYVPEGLQPGDPGQRDYLNQVNEQLVSRLQTGGETYLSNAVIDDRYFLRACVVNFRTTVDDILAIPEIVVSCGRRIHAELSGKNTD